MPRRKDINSILIIGSGPIRIGQACEFDYSGSQACKILKKDGFRVVLINSNLATIMTDPEMADAIYLEPITCESIEKILKKEKIDALLPTIGGQTSLNMAIELEKAGVLKKYNIELIGADIAAIKKAEDRKIFQKAMEELGYKMASSHHVDSLEKAHAIAKTMSFPIVIRPSFTLGGTGGAIAHNKEAFEKLVEHGLSSSMSNEVVLEQSFLGWGEYELEVMKDVADNVVIICSIENLDPMGVHTGDSITVAPQQTLSDREYQNLRNMSIAIIKKIGVATGGANIQFAIHPDTREVVVIEMNPRVSRSSALASKATGFPIAKIAAQLAVGYHLDEIKNDITKSTPAYFEPTIDYVVVKMPRFAFEKFNQSAPHLGIQMQSVGETMALGRTFCQALQKAIRGLEIGKIGFDGEIFPYKQLAALDKNQLEDFIESKNHLKEEVEKKVRENHYMRIFFIKDLFYFGYSVDDVNRLSSIDPWFLQNLYHLFEVERHYFGKSIKDLDKVNLLELKREGFSDRQIQAILCDPPTAQPTTQTTSKKNESAITMLRQQLAVRPSFKIVDTCAGEFQAQTPYFYSSYDEEDELEDFLKLLRQKENKGLVVILGSGPNRIGQGIEFDYMCVKACLALRALGYFTVMINCNPETVSTDYDISDLLFFEPLSEEETLEILKRLDPLGIMIHFGGQTPLNLAKTLSEHGFNILGTDSKSIFAAEDREVFKDIIEQLNYKQPPSQIVFNYEQGTQALKQLGLPLVVRPSFVLGGRAMEIVFDELEFRSFFEEAKRIADGNAILIDSYLQDAIELDIDLISDGKRAIIAGILEHIEQAGVHSGDSACLLPSQNIPQKVIDKIIVQAKSIALKMNIRGFLNLQIAVKQDEIYFLEANPRGSRTIPFLCKAMVKDWVSVAVRVMLGHDLTEDDLLYDYEKQKFHLQFIKEAFLPFDKFPNEDSILGPEMKSTGEVIGVGKNAAEAFYKAQLGVDAKLPSPKEGGILLTIDKKKEEIIPISQDLCKAGYRIYATQGTYNFLQRAGISSTLVKKLGEEGRTLIDEIVEGNIKLVFNTPTSRQALQNDTYIRKVARQYRISIITTLPAMRICTKALLEKNIRDFDVYSINKDYLKK